jgi:hypothetical protein
VIADDPTRLARVQGVQGGTDAADDFPELRTFADCGLLSFDGAKWTPTALGLERSDDVRTLMTT